MQISKNDRKNKIRVEKIKTMFQLRETDNKVDSPLSLNGNI